MAGALYIDEHLLGHEIITIMSKIEMATWHVDKVNAK